MIEIEKVTVVEVRFSRVIEQKLGGNACATGKALLYKLEVLKSYMIQIVKTFG
jgi:hypothetical protein